MIAADSLPLTFRPDIRLIRGGPGIDTDAYLTRLATILFPHTGRDDIQDRVDRMRRAPVPTATASEVIAAAGPNVGARLRALGARVDATARETFIILPDALLSSSTTIVDPTDHSYPPGTVVWIRHGDEADLQFVLPRLGVDVKTGEVEERDLSRQPDARRVLVRAPAPALPTVASVVSSTLEVATSVSWALPPPFNVGVTAGLTVLQILMRATNKPAGPSPMDQLKTDLETWFQLRATDEKLNHIRLFSEDLLLKTDQFTFGPDQIAVAGSGAAQEFRDRWHSPTGIERLEDDVNDLISGLEQEKTVDSASDLLAAACSGITMWTTGQKVRMQLAACQLAAQLATGDASGFVDSTASWRTILDQIQKRLFDLLDADGAVVVKGWSSRVAAWIDTTRNARLARLHAVERVSRRFTYSGTTSGGFPYYVDETDWGWRFVDDADGNEWAHFVVDTTEQVDNCHSKTVEHQTEVTTAYLQHRNDVIARLDSATTDATQILQALHTKVLDIAALQPPSPPKDKLPTVTLHTSGTATPAGLWTKGATVSYQIAFANDHGPSDPGPATVPLEIGDFAFATLTGLPQDPKASAVQIVRTIVPSTGATPIPRHIRSVDMGTTTVDDLGEK